MPYGYVGSIWGWFWDLFRGGLRFMRVLLKAYVWLVQGFFRVDLGIILDWFRFYVFFPVSGLLSDFFCGWFRSLGLN